MSTTARVTAAKGTTPMADVRSLDAFRKSKKKQAAAGNTLCKNGHHRWKPDKTTQFDSKLGKLITRYECERCGKRKVQSD